MTSTFMGATSARAACVALALRLRVWASKICMLITQLLLLASTLTAASVVRLEVLLDAHPRLRTTRNALCHIGAFIIGAAFVDEHIAFTKPELVKSDAYRDRLLVPEIADLVDLCDALRLSLAQRKALFQCFRHLDFMRRAGVTRTELLRYCGLRITPLSCFLLPESRDGATHRSGMMQRWDILQWLALCFSVCTLEIDKLLQISIAEACQPPATERPSSLAGELNEDQPTQSMETLEAASELETHLPASPRIAAITVSAAVEPSLCDQIAQCFAFFIGVLSTNELHLQTLLCELYRANDGGPATSRIDAVARARLDFERVHGVTSVLDVAKLFPVLIFPCVWTQRVLQRRILGVSTWRVLQARRRELQAVGLSATFLSFSDIITAAQVHVHRKCNRQQQQQPPSPWRARACCESVWSRLRSWNHRLQTSDRTPLGNSDDSPSPRTDVRVSTPRKILPSIDAAIASSDGIELDSWRDACGTDTRHALGFANLDEAWRVTMNHVIASVCIELQHSERLSSTSSDQTAAAKALASTEEAREHFLALARQVASGSLAHAQCEAVRKALVRAHGYQFAKFVFAKSSLHDATAASKPSAEERRTQQRFAKAWASCDIPEDKPSYWKQLFDPASKQAFYYNLRTGESRWEKPANFVASSAKRKKRRAKRD